VLCNTHIKWRALLKRADALGCDFIATGHYASVRQHENGRYVISKAVDETKDQSYVLWGLQQDLLSRTILPLGTYRKTEIRQMAHDFGYPELAKKAESYEICFVPDNDYRGFLKRKVAGLEKKVDGGAFVNKEGKILGRHKGYPFYTIGQRKGLEITFGKPAYVTAIDPDTNTVVLGDEEDLEKEDMEVARVNWIKYADFTEPMEVFTKIHNSHQAISRQRLVRPMLWQTHPNHKPQTAHLKLHPPRLQLRRMSRPRLLHLQLLLIKS
jgi:tRNA-specific 2-thiouridylase